MGLFPQINSALGSVADDEEAPLRLRLKALELMPRPSLNMLRRLMVQHKPGSMARQKSKYKKPVPRKLRALAAIRYAEQWRIALIRRERKKRKASPFPNNMLGL